MDIGRFGADTLLIFIYLLVCDRFRAPALTQLY